MESPPLCADAKPYIPLATCVGPPPVAVAKLPSPGFFPQPVPYPYQPPPPQAVFLSGLPGCWGFPPGPGGVGIPAGALPHPAWAPPMPPPHEAIATSAGSPYAMARAPSQGSGKQPSRSRRTGRVPGTRLPPPCLDVPPRLLRPAAGRRPGPSAASRGSKAAGARGLWPAKEDPASRCPKAPVAGEEAAANEPSPRSVLVASSPPISPTTSLPSSFPLPCLPPAATAQAPPTEPPAHCAEHGAGTMPAGPPKMRRRRGPRRAQPVSGPDGEVRRGAMKPRLLFDPASRRTTLMIRHLPNHFTRMRLMAIIDEHCFIENEKIAPGGVRSEYDFLYVPIDFRTLANKGYAFVNMTSPDAARRLWQHLHGHRWEVKRCGKTCAVDYAAVQGLDRLLDHFSWSSFVCDSEELLPLRFEPPRDGTRPAHGVAHVVGCLRRRS